MNQQTDHGVILITGANRGLGLGLACLSASLGVSVVLTSRSQQALQRVVEFLQPHAAVLGVQADAADEVAMTRAFDAAKSLGTLQGVVNNAGQLEPVGSVLDIDLEAFERALRTNVTGVLVGTRLALRSRNPGFPMRIVNVSSGAATRAYSGWAAYCASKAAVNLLTEVSALDAAEANTSIVAVAPGIIETRMQRTIRAVPEDRFPDRRTFIQLKDSGALLHPVHAAVTLDWLVRTAPMSLSGRFVDARGEELVDATRGHREKMSAKIETATGWFERLEPHAD